MARFLVTGGCGFIGSHLVGALLRDGHDVLVLDDLSSGRAEKCDKNATLVIGSVIDERVVGELVARVDGCFHLAAIASVQKCNRELTSSHHVNIGGFLALVAAAQHAGRDVPIVYASSAAVYGDVSQVARESVIPKPISHYGCDKLACEQHARVAFLNEACSSIGLRFFNVYGPGQDSSSPYSGVLSIFLDSIASGRMISVYGDGRQTRDFVYVGDVVRAQVSAMRLIESERRRGRRCFGIYNVCSGTATSILDLAETVFTTLGKRSDIIFEPERAGDIRMSVGSGKAAAARLGFAAETSLSVGCGLVAASRWAHVAPSSETRECVPTPA